MSNVKIVGTGMCVPQSHLKNEDLIIENKLDTTDKWIRENVGIKQRRVVTDETSASLGAEAVKNAVKDANMSLKDVDLLIVATTTPTKMSPSTACIIKDSLLMEDAVAFDIAAVCSGFLFGLDIASQYIGSGRYTNAVVVGVDVFSTITDWTHKHSIFFGDGAGAFVLKKDYKGGFLGFKLYSDSKDSTGFFCNHGETFTMNTRSVYDTATRVLPIAVYGILSKLRS